MAARLGILAAAMAVLAGCAHSDGREGLAALEGLMPPRPPPLLSGPMGVLLTNVNGFSARAVMATGFSSNRVEVLSGELLGRGSWLLFAPEFDESMDKHSRAARLSFIWNVVTNSGYVLSEALQGYAPMTQSIRYTNVVAKNLGPAPEKVDSHICERENATITSSEGSATELEVWRAADLRGFPVLIATATRARPVSLSLSNVRLKAPPEDLFRPPEGFTPYSSAETMLTELVMRQQSLRSR